SAAPRFARATPRRSLSCPHFQPWILSKNYSLALPALQPSKRSPQIRSSIRDLRSLPPAIENRKSTTENSHHFVTFAVCEPCFLKIRVGENSPSLWPTM